MCFYIFLSKVYNHTEDPLRYRITPTNPNYNDSIRDLANFKPCRLCLFQNIKDAVGHDLSSRT